MDNTDYLIRRTYTNYGGRKMCDKGLQEIGTRKYNIMINKEYLVRFDEIQDKTGMGSYTNGVLVGFSAISATDVIITSKNKSEAMIIDGKFNLKSIMTKILSDMSYKFYNIEIIEIGD